MFFFDNCLKNILVQEKMEDVNGLIKIQSKQKRNCCAKNTAYLFF
jgi:hypothetical protein